MMQFCPAVLVVLIMQLNPAPTRNGLYVGDRVISRGIVTRGFGIGKVTHITRNVATVLFDGGRVETYNVAQLRKVAA